MKRLLWTIPRIWDDATCVLLGGGPSLKDIDLTRLAGEHVIAVNDAYKLGPWDAMYFGDVAWYERNYVALSVFSGLKVTTHERLANEPGIKAVRRLNAPYGISRDPSTLYWNLSSGAEAIQLAVHLGATRIVLLGYDMRKIGQDRNWHREHPDWNDPRKLPYDKFQRPFPQIAADLMDMGIKCVNATPGSALTVFPIMDPDDVLPALKGQKARSRWQVTSHPRSWRGRHHADRRVPS